MMVTGNTTRHPDKALSITRTVTFTRANGYTTNQMVLVYIRLQMELGMKVAGKTTSSMDME